MKSVPAVSLLRRKGQITSPAILVRGVIGKFRKVDVSLHCSDERRKASSSSPYSLHALGKAAVGIATYQNQRHAHLKL